MAKVWNYLEKNSGAIVTLMTGAGIFYGIGAKVEGVSKELESFKTTQEGFKNSLSSYDKSVKELDSTIEKLNVRLDDEAMEATV